MNKSMEKYFDSLQEVADMNYEGLEGRGVRHGHVAPKGYQRSSVTGRVQVQNPKVANYSPQGGHTQALVDIIVQRIGTNFGDLPFGVFGYSFIPSQFNSLINVPPGLTLTLDTSNPLQIDFVYTDGVNTDKVRVSSTQNNYIAFLQGLASDMFNVSKVRIALSDTTNLDQFSRVIELGEKTMFGKRQFTPIPANSLKSPFQFQPNVIDLGTDSSPLNYGVDKNVVFLSSIKAVNLFTVTYSYFINNLERLNFGMLNK
jgi:hypothetical protein